MVARFAYDAYDRVVTIYKYPHGVQGNQWVNTDDVCQRVRYFYDSYGSSTGAYGHVAAVTTGGADVGCSATQQFTQMFSYNSAGRVTTKNLEMAQSGTVTDWAVGYTYNSFGQVASTSYPSGGPTYTVGFDNMQRPHVLNDNASNTIVSGVTYNAAGQPTQTVFGTIGSISETRSYNILNQLTGIVAGNSLYPGINMSYSYPSGSNNGQIMSDTDGFAGQTVGYTYDAMKRLVTASSSSWSQTFGYDGFGNMTSKVNSGSISSTVSFGVDASTNRLSGTNVCYDPAGNMVSDQNGGGCNNPNYAYDASNRLVRAGAEIYQYGADNKRLSRTTAGGALSIYIYGAMGEKIGVVNPNLTLSFDVYFSGRLIGQTTLGATGGPALVFTDRLGSVRGIMGASPSTSRYLPYGEEITSSGNDSIKFATYTRDGATGLDYADQRFYTSQFGRFLSADRFKRAAKANDSGSWNKYSYVSDDPVNHKDNLGLFERAPEEPDPTYCQVYPNDDICLSVGAPGGGLGDGDHGGGGGDSAPTLKELLDASIARVKQDLLNQDCAKDFKNGSKASDKVGDASFGALGLLAFTSDGSVGGSFGQYDGHITLNTAVNWLDPANTIALSNGNLFIYNALSRTAPTLGVSSLTANQFIDQVLLHEVAHYNSKIGDPDNAAVNKQLFEDCVKK